MIETCMHLCLTTRWVKRDDGTKRVETTCDDCKQTVNIFGDDAEKGE